MPVSFADLGVDPALVAKLTERGIAAPFPIQEAAIPDSLAGRDVVAKAPTGSGKTIAFGVAAIERCIARDAERAAARDASATSIAGEGFTKLLAAFAAAKANKLKYPKVRIDTLAFSLAGDNSANRGCVYVKAGETYLGKITAEGKLFASRDCDASNRALIEQVGRDPLAAAVAHGHKTGNCAMCGRELTDPDSVARGIGPICADNFGL